MDDECRGASRCADPPKEDEGLVVYINPAEPISVARFEKYERDLTAKLKALAKEGEAIDGKRKRTEADWPTYLVSPYLINVNNRADA